MFEYVGTGAIITLVVLCVKLSNGVVRRSDCHLAQNNIRDLIADLKDTVNTRIDDIKELINGKK